MLERFGDKACYTYNSAGIRTEKCIQGVPTKYVVSGSTLLSETTNGSTTVYYYSTDGIIGFNRGGANYFYRKNIQGDIIAIINSVGSTIVKYVYDAWGNHKAYNATGSVIYDSTNPTAYNAYTNHVGYLNPFRYRGYYFDNETGLYYLQSRYYDPQVGRFINADSINYIDAKNFSGLNLYAYCYNNPIMFYDNTGCKASWLWWLAVGVLAIVGSAFAVGALLATATVYTATIAGMGVGAVTSMAISISQQGGFAKADPSKVIFAMGIGILTGAISGAIGFTASSVANAIGFEIGTNIAKVIGSSIISSTSTMLLTTASSAIAGAVAGTASNILLNRAFDGLDGEHETLGETITGAVQSDAISWFMDLLKWLFV